jgi:hypothetical protein
MKTKLTILLIACALLIACSDPKNTALPDDISKIESIRPDVEKLKPEEKQLLAGYLMRRGIANILPGGTKNTTMTATTIGQAIEQQKDYASKVAIREAEDKIAAEKIKAEHEAAITAMRDVVSIGLVKKSIGSERGASGMEIDKGITVSFSFSNKSSKDISGIKGKIIAIDQFGDEISAFQISVDEGIKAGGATVWEGSRSVKYAFGSNNKDEKFAALPDDKYMLVWEPQTIVFTGGTKLSAAK